MIDTDFGPGIFEFRDGKIDAPSKDGPESLHLLERNATTHRKTLTEHEQMSSLLQLNTKLETDADANAALRSTFRRDRKAKKRRLKDAASVGLGRGIEMTEETGDDAFTAKRLMQKTHGMQARQLERDNFSALRGSSIFGSKTLKGTKRLDVKRRHETGQYTQKKRSDATILAGKPQRIRKKETTETAKQKTKIAAGNNDSCVSAMGALAAYGSDSDSSGD